MLHFPVTSKYNKVVAFFIDAHSCDWLNEYAQYKNIIECASINRISGHFDVGVGKFGESAKRPTMCDVRAWTLHFGMNTSLVIAACSILQIKLNFPYI